MTFKEKKHVYFFIQSMVFLLFYLCCFIVLDILLCNFNIYINEIADIEKKLIAVKKSYWVKAKD